MIRKRDDNEQKAILAILLSLAVYWIWSAQYMPPPPAEGAAIADVSGGAVDAGTQGGATGALPSTPGGQATPTPADQPERTTDLHTGEIDSTLSTRGGGLVEVSLPNHNSAYEIVPFWTRAIELVTGSGEDSWRPYGDEPGVAELLSGEGVLVSAGNDTTYQDGSYTLISESPITFQRVTPDGLKITKIYAPTGEPDLLDVTVTFENTGSAVLQAPRWVGAADTFYGDAGRYTNAFRPAGVVDGGLETQDDLEDLLTGPITEPGGVSWLGIGDRYFMSALVPSDPHWGALTFASAGGVTAANAGGEPGHRAGAFLVRSQPLAPGQQDTLGLSVYMGPKNLERLGAVGHDLKASVDLGFFGFFAKVLLWVLQRFHDLVGNWGVSIMLLTLMVKGAFWPLTQKSFTSNRAMQAIQPELTELREKYKDDPQTASVKQMELFKERGVNPLAGCLPMLVQMPVWFALYSVLLYASDIYHAEFLYLRDLSSPDPIGIFPTVVGIMMVLQQRLTPMSPTMDPTQKMMMKAMPLVFVVFIYAFPSGLAVYIFVNTLLSILQMWLINRAYPIQTPQTAAVSAK